MRASYGWKSARELIAEKVQFRRFMMVNGYGRDVLAVTFERRPGSSPQVAVEVPQEEEAEALGLPPPTPLTGALGKTHWQRALNLTLNFDEELAREVPNDQAEQREFISVCLHSWVVVIEGADYPVSGDGGESTVELRTDIEDGCSDGLAMPAAFALAELAYEALPECHDLELEEYRNRVMLLAYCKRLGGDRVAATKAAAFIKKLEDATSAGEEPNLSPFFAYGDRDQAAEFEQKLANAELNVGIPHASDQAHAIVVGSLEPKDQPSADDNTYHYADVTIQLEASNATWHIADYEISEMKTIKFKD